MRVFSDRLFERSHGGADGVREGEGQQWGGGGNSAFGAIVVGWSTAGVSLTSQNRHSHHKYKSPKQSELKQK